MAEKNAASAAPEQNKMGVMPIGRLLLSMGLPMVLSMLVQALYNIVDSLFVARVSEAALTAVSMAFPVQNFMIAAVSGMAVGVNSLLSRSLGERNIERANRAANAGIILSFLTMLLFLLFGIFGAEAFFRLQTTDAEIIRQGTDYVRICCILSFGSFGQIIFERLLQSTGMAHLSMASQMTGAIANIILDPIMIFGYFGFPRMEAAGAALATVIGQIGAFLLYIVVYLHKNPGVTIHPRYLKLNWPLIRRIYSVGIPSSLMLMMPSLLVSALNGILAAFSEVYVAVLGVYFKLQTFIYMPANGMVQ